MHTIDQEFFHKFKAHSDHILEHEHHILDQRILPLVKALNKVPGLTTTWSCSGHTGEEERQRTNGIKYETSRRWYITFVMTGDNEDFINMLSSAMSNVSEWTQLQLRPKLTMMRLYDGSITKSNSWYNSWSMEGIFRDPEDFISLLSTYWDALIKAIDEYVESIQFHKRNKESPEPKLWDIWAEGFSATGESSGAILLTSKVEAKTFTEAVETWLKMDTSHNPYITKQKDGTYTYWGCRLFDNERDARKSFG